MKIKDAPNCIVPILLGTLSIFCLISLQPGLSAEVSPLSTVEPFYPDSLSDVREFHESFIDSPSSALEQRYSGREALYAIDSKDAIDNCSPELGHEIVFDGDGEPVGACRGGDDFQEIVAINTEDHRSTEKQVTYVLTDQPAEGPDGVNAMNIEVAHITVIAINFAKGGSAVATSDIYLAPTQDQGGHCPSAS